MIEQKHNKLMYIVYDYDDGIVIQTDDYEAALKEYNRCKASWEQYFDGEFSTYEKTVLAVVLKDFYSDETEEKNENGDNYWSFYEDTYETKRFIGGLMYFNNFQHEKIVPLKQDVLLKQETLIPNISK